MGEPYRVGPRACQASRAHRPGAPSVPRGTRERAGARRRRPRAAKRRRGSGRRLERGLVDFRQRDLIELRVGLLLLVQGLLEQLGGVVVAERLGQGAHRAVARDLVMLDFLGGGDQRSVRSEEHTSELQSRENLVCRLLLEKKKKV